MVDLRIYSFGYGHIDDNVTLLPEKPDIVIDVRDWFRDPHILPGLQYMDGKDNAVICKVMSTPGVQTFVEDLVSLIRCLLAQGGRTVVVAIGCVGGRHRSVVIADLVSAMIQHGGFTAEAVHRHIDRPVLARRGGDTMPKINPEQEAQRKAATSLPAPPVITPEQRAERSRKLLSKASWHKK